MLGRTANKRSMQPVTPGYPVPPLIPPPPPAVVRPPSDSGAVVSLVLGILGLVWLVGIGPLAALYFGYQAKLRIEASQGRISGRGMAVAGIVLGWLGVAAACALVFLVLRPG